MYIPRWYREDRPAVLREAIEQIGFGTLVTITPLGLVATHIPMMIDSAKGEQGVLYGHIARNNSQWRNTLTDAEALAIFVGPNAYISPTWYKTKEETGKVDPTWDYIAVHVYGKISFFDDRDRLLQIVSNLTNHHERATAVPKPWSVDDAPKEYIDDELKSMIGFELKIGRIEGKWKLSQNRSKEDLEGVIRGLEKRRDQASIDVAEEIRKKKEEI